MKKLSDREVANMIKSTAKRPQERLQSINKMAQALNLNKNSMMKALEFTIADQPLNIDGRILPAPKLTMSEELVPFQGVWDARAKQFYNPAPLNSWVVVNYEPYRISRDLLQNFLDSMIKMGRERGMAIAYPHYISASRDANPEKEFLEFKSKYPDLQLILVVLPEFGDVYSRVKIVGDKEIEVVTQCIKSSSVKSRQFMQIIGNVLLKINAKVGGTNFIISRASSPVVFTKPVMIMGADVNHPQAGDKVTPSVAAVVASMDRFASKYAVEVRHQMHRTEMIQDMKDMTKNLLKAFYSATKNKPERIVMYRDGVGESQFTEVLSFELKAMRAACTELQKDYTPAITFIVVQKRHHTRLFCNERDGVGKSKNVPPGTTVDRHITSPNERDFYMCSHQGIQGTSRPSHYYVLWDDSDLTMDQLQNLTYAMCHLYSRCTRSVSIPTPAYYSHLAAFRGKVYINDICHSDTTSQLSGEVAISDSILAKACRIAKEDKISNKAFYV
ncbi:argonaute 1 [Halocaridina rubra]|uniref:Argonaute 1 n=1 Tax=Halocaridina rubra TaxID=373956 RepID=A0AAN9AFU2_HALRR